MPKTLVRNFCDKFNLNFAEEQWRSEFLPEVPLRLAMAVSHTAAFPIGRAPLCQRDSGSGLDSGNSESI